MDEYICQPVIRSVYRAPSSAGHVICVGGSLTCRNTTQCEVGLVCLSMHVWSRSAYMLALDPALTFVRDFLYCTRS